MGGEKENLKRKEMYIKRNWNKRRKTELKQN